MGLLRRAMDESYLCRVMSSWIGASLTFTWRAFFSDVFFCSPFIYLSQLLPVPPSGAVAAIFLQNTKGTAVCISSGTPLKHATY